MTTGFVENARERKENKITRECAWVTVSLGNRDSDYAPLGACLVYLTPEGDHSNTPFLYITKLFLGTTM